MRWWQTIVAMPSVAMPVCLLAFGCTKGCADKPPHPRSQPTPLVEAAGNEAPSEARAGARSMTAKANSKVLGSYAAAVRAAEYDRAKTLLDELPEPERKQPEVRYVRAKVALALGDFEIALTLAEGLRQDAPAFSREALALSIEAAKLSGDATLVEHFLGNSARGPVTEASIEPRLTLAEAYRASSNLEAALSLTEDVIRVLGKKAKTTDRDLALEGRARRLRAEVFENLDQNDRASREYRWLASRGKLLPEGDDADDRAEQLDPARPLGAELRLERARAFAERGWVERTDRELRRVGAAPGKRPAEEETDAILALAVFVSRTDDARAAQLFASAARAGGPDRKKHLYYEARALLRAGSAKEALQRFEQLALLGGAHGESARREAARIRYVTGDFAGASAAYDEYSRRFPSGSFKGDVAYERAVSLLALGKHDRARKAFAELGRAAKDPLERARLWELEAIALLGLGHDVEALGLLRRTIDERPLSLPALFAEARITLAGEVAPPRLSPSQAVPPEPPLVVELPDKVWRLHRVGLDEEAEAALSEQEAALEKRYGSRKGEALCRLYGQLESARRRYQIAQTAVSLAALSREPSARTGWQWDCVYPEPYEAVVAELAKHYALPEPLIYGVMRQESAFRPSVVSPANAVGLMQLIPPTAQRIAEELKVTYDPRKMSVPAVNIQFGSHYLRKLLDMFKGNAALAAAAYNAGPSAVGSWLEGGRDLPLDLFVARIPFAETRGYVVRVLGNHARYAYLEKRPPEPLRLELPKDVVVPPDAY